MASLQSWIDQTRGHLLSGHQEQRNTVAVGGYTAGSGTLTLASAVSGIVAGTRLSVGLNTFYVLSVNTTGLAATVLGGQAGTTDANAVAGDLVRVNPMVTDSEILNALMAEVDDLSAPDNGLFQIKTVSLTATTGIGYDLTGVSSLLDVYEVRPQATGTQSWWTQMAKLDWRLDRNADTALFPSGLSLQLFGTTTPGYAIRVLYRAGFVFPPTTATDLSTTGMPGTSYDIPPIGAAMRLMAPREIKRNRTEFQSDTRRAAEVPPGAVQGSYRGLMMLRQARVAAEAARLTAAYPDKRF